MIALVAAALLSASQSVWVVEKPLIEVARVIKQNLDDPNAQVPADMWRVLAAVDLEAKLYARPKDHYYKAEFNAGYRKLRLNKTLEVWGQGNRTLVKSTVSITRNSGCRLVTCLVKHIVPRIEERILQFEQSTLLELMEQ